MIELRCLGQCKGKAHALLGVIYSNLTLVIRDGKRGVILEEPTPGKVLLECPRCGIRHRLEKDANDKYCLVIAANPKDN